MKCFYSLIIFSFFACKRDYSAENKAALIEAAIEEKLDKVRRRKLDQCKKNALDAAIKHVDSLIAKEFSLNMIDTIQFPRPPQRPSIPGGKIILDTQKVTPIILKEK